MEDQLGQTWAMGLLQAILSFPIFQKQEWVRGPPLALGHLTML